MPPFTAAFDSVAAAAFCAVPDALCAAELVAALEVVVALAAFVDADEPAVCEAIGAVDCPSICFCTASEKEPDMPDMVNLEEKASAGYCGDVASLRPRDSKRMKLRAGQRAADATGGRGLTRTRRWGRSRRRG